MSKSRKKQQKIEDLKVDLENLEGELESVRSQKDELTDKERGLEDDIAVVSEELYHLGEAEYGPE